MSIVAKATVPAPSPKLLTAVKKGNASELFGYRPKLTRSGHIIFTLRVNVALSVRLHPEGWYAEAGEYAPRPNAPLTAYVFDTPEPLLDENGILDEKVGWRIEKRETSFWQPPYESYTVIADHHGMPLQPYYRRDNRINYTRPHPTDSYFSAPGLGQVEWTRVVQADDSVTGILRAKVAKITFEIDHPVVCEEVVYCEEGPELADLDSFRLDALPAKWHGALQGLRERARCTEKVDCRGHFYSD